jgi:hypothetical protein
MATGLREKFVLVLFLQNSTNTLGDRIDDVALAQLTCP